MARVWQQERDFDEDQHDGGSKRDPHDVNVNELLSHRQPSDRSAKTAQHRRCGTSVFGTVRVLLALGACCSVVTMHILQLKLYSSI